jgi:hypothetical protein
MNKTNSIATDLTATIVDANPLFKENILINCCFEVIENRISNFYQSCFPFNFSAITGAKYKYSNPSGMHKKTNNFIIYKNDFQVLDSQFDINKYYTEAEFVSNVKRLFLVLKYLNLVDDYTQLTEMVILNIQTNGAYRFDLKELVNGIKVFDLLPINEALKYEKNRNYIFTSEEKIDKYEFLKQLREAKLKYKTWSQLYAIKNLVRDATEEVKFIDRLRLGIYRKDSSIYVSDLIDQFNIASLGTTNLRTAKAFLETHKKFVPEFVQYNIGTIIVRNLEYKNSNILKLSNEIGVSRSNLTFYINLNRDIERIKSIYKEISFYIANIDMLSVQTNGKYCVMVSNPLHFEEYSDDDEKL